VCQQRNTLRATTQTPDNGPSETKTSLVVEEGHEIGVVKPGTAQKAALKTVCVHTKYEVKYDD
jgi:hypothetical protein